MKLKCKINFKLYSFVIWAKLHGRKFIHVDVEHKSVQQLQITLRHLFFNTDKINGHAFMDSLQEQFISIFKNKFICLGNKKNECASPRFVDCLYVLKSHVFILFDITWGVQKCSFFSCSQRKTLWGEGVLSRGYSEADRFHQKGHEEIQGRDRKKYDCAHTHTHIYTAFVWSCLNLFCVSHILVLRGQRTEIFNRVVSSSTDQFCWAETEHPCHRLPPWQWLWD